MRGVRCPRCQVGWGTGTLVHNAGVVAEDGVFQWTDPDGQQTVLAYSQPIQATSAKSWQVTTDDGTVYTISKEGCGCRKGS